MSPDRNRLHLAVQKSGRLNEDSLALLRGAGIRLSRGGKSSLSARADNFPLDLMLVRDDDIPTFVADGVCELGIVGQNVLEEYALGQSERRIEEIARLGFGRCSLKIAAPDSLNFFQLKMLDWAADCDQLSKSVAPLSPSERHDRRHRHHARRG